MKNTFLLYTLGVLSLGIFLYTGCNRQPTLHPEQLTCEYLPGPEVVDVLQPRLAWINTGTEGIRGQEQRAWQVRVGGSEEKLETADLWNSGKQRSNQSAHG